MSDSPAASRLATPRWLDLRLVLGVVLVLVSVVVGARLLASADRTEQVWATTADLAPGSTLTADDLERVQVRLRDRAPAYVPGTGAAPVGYVLTRGLGAGELLPRAALREPATTADLRDVSLPVEPGHLPSDLSAGQLVDVYVTVEDDAGTASAPSPAPSAGPTRLVLADVAVVRRESDDGRGGDGSEAVVLSVPATDVAGLVSALRGGTVDLVRVPDGADLGRLPAAGSPG